MDINRKVAYEVLYNVEKNGAYSNIALNDATKKHQLTLPSFTRELVHGVIRYKLTLDYYISKLVDKPIKKKKTEIMILLRMGIYQIMYMDSVPDYSACSETVDIAKSACGFYSGFINGVLRNFSRKKTEISLPEGNDIKSLSIRYSFPEPLVKLWIDEFGKDDTIKLMKGSNESPQLSIRANRQKISREGLIEELESDGIECIPSMDTSMGIIIKGKDIFNSRLFKEGFFSVQDNASIFAIEKLNVDEGSQILDLCAAPGGKSMALAEWVGPTGQVISCDVYEHKIELIDLAAKRLGLSQVKTVLNDGLLFKDEWESKFDYVVVDGPCSGLGVIRRRPEIKYKDIDDKGISLAKIQLQLLINGSKYLKKGGRIMYSTCTINKFENKNVILDFLRENTGFNVEFEKQLLPLNELNDGFYICIFKKEY